MGADPLKYVQIGNSDLSEILAGNAPHAPSEVLATCRMDAEASYPSSRQVVGG